MFTKNIVYSKIINKIIKKCDFASIGRADGICRVRRAVEGQFSIKRIMTNCTEYTHASREMAAHLTRRVNTPLPMFTEKHYI